MRGRQREARRRLRALEHEVALFAVGHLIDELKERYARSDKLTAWLTSVQEDVIENLAQFQAAGGQPGAEPSSPLAQAIMGGPEHGLARYEVNVLVASDSNGGAPVVAETNPTYSNLFGRIEHQGVLGGGFVTDHQDASPRCGPPRQWRVSAVARGGGARPTAGVAEAQGGAADGADSPREPGRAICPVPDRDAHAGADRAGPEGRPGGFAVALRAGLRRSTRMCASCFASRRNSTGASPGTMRA